MKKKVLGLAMASVAALSLMAGAAGVANAQQPPVDGVCGYVIDGFDVPVRNGVGGNLVTNALGYTGPCEGAPPPPPGDQYIVFFDFDRSAITPAAATIISAAADAAIAAPANAVAVSGYTDTSGSPAYNLALGQRRADAVAGALASEGVNPAIITTASFGETNLLVPTPDGVRNPENRRAVIELQ